MAYGELIGYSVTRAITSQMSRLTARKKVANGDSKEWVARALPSKNNAGRKWICHNGTMKKKSAYPMKKENKPAWITLAIGKILEDGNGIAIPPDKIASRKMMDRYGTMKKKSAYPAKSTKQPVRRKVKNG